MANAKDVMENGKPTWLKCCLNFDSLLIVKKKKFQVTWLRRQFLTRWSVFEMPSSALKMQGRLGLVSMP